MFPVTYHCRPRKTGISAHFHVTRTHALRAAALSVVLLLLMYLPTLANAQTFRVLDIHPNSASILEEEVIPSQAHREGFLSAFHALTDNTGTSPLAPRIEFVTVDDPDHTMSTEQVVRTALQRWPDLIAVFGPYNADAALELMGNSVLIDNHLVCLGLASNSQTLRGWTPNFYFFRAEPTTEAVAMVRYTVSTLNARRIGFMYINGTHFGELSLATVFKELERTPITADQVAVYKGTDVNGALDEAALERFLSMRPQVVMLFGFSGALTSAFTARLLSDPRTSSARLLVPSTVAGTAFNTISDLVKNNANNENGLTTETHFEPASDEQILFTTTNHLGTETSYEHIRHYQTQMRAFVTDGLSEVYTADKPDAFLADERRREMGVAGWIGGTAMARALRDPTWWNVDAGDGYATEGATLRERFMNYLFQPSRSYVVGGDLLVGGYGGKCNADAGLVPEMGVPCECNQGGRTAFVSKLVVANMSLVPVPEYTFSYSNAYCNVHDVYVLHRPIGAFLITVKEFFNPGYAQHTGETPTTQDLTVTAEEDALFNSLSNALNGATTRAAKYYNRLYPTETFTVQRYSPTAKVAEKTLTAVFTDYLLTTLIGTVRPSVRLEGVFMIHPFYPKPAVDKELMYNKVFILPTLPQQTFVALQFVSLIAGLSRDKAQIHSILRGMSKDHVPGITELFHNTTQTFGFPECQITEIDSQEPLLTGLRAQPSVRKVVLGIESGDAAVIAQYLQDNPDAFLLIVAMDLIVWHDEIKEVFGKYPVSVRRRLFFPTSLPIWSDTSDAARAASPLLTAYQDSLLPGESPTPLGIVSWMLIAFTAELTKHITGPVTPTSMADAVYNTQSFNVEGVSLQGFQRCETNGSAVQGGNSGQKNGKEGASSGDGSYVVKAAECVPRNFGATNIQMFSAEVLFTPSTAPSFGPVTPSMVFTVPRSSGLSKGALIGIIVGCVVAVGIVAAIAVVMCCCCRSGARDNKNAPQEISDPVTLIFTDIESSTALWAADPEEMPDMVATHHRLIRHLIAQYRCYEVKTIGDSFMIACKDPFAAVKLASDIQTSFLAFDWKTTALDDCYHNFELAKERASQEARRAITTPTTAMNRTRHHGETNANEDDETPEYVCPTAHLADDVYAALWHGLRVRIGIHSGLTDIRHDEVTKGFDYYGETANMTARTEAIGNGGQIVVTEATWWALSQAERDSLSCTPLGKQCLRGVPYEVDMFQIDAVVGRQFAPLRVDIEARLPPDPEDEDDSFLLTQNNTSRGSFSTEGGGPDVGAIGANQLHGVSKIVSTLLTVMFRPFRGRDKIDSMKPLLDRWGIPMPMRQKNVASDAFAQGLLNRLAIKVGKVSTAGLRLPDGRANSGFSIDWEDLAHSSTLGSVGTWTNGGMESLLRDRRRGTSENFVRRHPSQASTVMGPFRRCLSTSVAPDAVWLPSAVQGSSVNAEDATVPISIFQLRRETEEATASGASGSAHDMVRVNSDVPVNRTVIVSGLDDDDDAGVVLGNRTTKSRFNQLRSRQRGNNTAASSIYSFASSEGGQGSSTRWNPFLAGSESLSASCANPFATGAPLRRSVDPCVPAASDHDDSESSDENVQASPNILSDTRRAIDGPAGRYGSPMMPDICLPAALAAKSGAHQPAADATTPTKSLRQKLIPAHRLSSDRSVAETIIVRRPDMPSTAESESYQNLASTTTPAAADQSP